MQSTISQQPLAHILLTGVCLSWLFVLSEKPVLAQFGPPQEVDRALQSMMQLTPAQRAELRKVNIPIKAEKEYGESIFESFRQQLAAQKIQVTNRGVDATYLQRLVNIARPQMAQRDRYNKVQVYLVESTTVDARSTPGGILVFYRGLLEIAENEAALLGIVCHELSHLDRQHQLKPLQQQQLANKQLNQLQSGQFDFGRMMDFGKISFSSYHPIHPDEEAEADQDAVSWMYQLGYDPEQLARLFQRLASNAQGNAELIPGFLRTHPLMKDRAAKVLEQTKQLQTANPQANLIVGTEALKRRSPAKK